MRRSISGLSMPASDMDTRLVMRLSAIMSAPPSINALATAGWPQVTLVAAATLAPCSWQSAITLRAFSVIRSG